MVSTKVSTRAIGWRLDRRDGLRLGFCSHDRLIRISGFDYHPQPGLKITSIRRSGQYEPGGLDIEGALDSRFLKEGDLLAGRWKQAEITAFSFDWEKPDADIRWLMRSHIARIALEDGLLRAELVEARPQSERIVPRTSPGCRAIFAGPQCGLSLARFRHEASAVAIDGAVVTLDAVPAVAAFVGGSLRWLDGPNCGLRQAIVSHNGTELRLDVAPYFAMQLPVSVELVEGCDHSFETCTARFANGANFRGEPHLPGMDFITRYPGS